MFEFKMGDWAEGTVVHHLFLEDNESPPGSFCGGNKLPATTVVKEVNCPDCLRKIEIYSAARAALKRASRIGPPEETEQPEPLIHLAAVSPVQRSVCGLNALETLYYKATVYRDLVTCANCRIAIAEGT